MNISVYVAHPSQYYVFRRTIELLEKRGHSICIYAKSKDMLNDILRSDNKQYINVYPYRKKAGSFNLVLSVLLKNKNLYKYIKKQKSDLLITGASDSCQASFIYGIPSIALNDDDASIVKNSVFFGWPFASHIFAPKSCHMGFWKRKSLFYKGYQKLFYLHPNHFSPNKKTAEQYVPIDKPYFLIRSVSLTAHHDKNIRGLNNELVESLTEKLKPHGQVIISSERALPESLEKYRLQINPLDMHHLISFASLIIGDSQSMAQEAALLGTPSIRFNDFVGRIGVMEELGHKYGLTFGISPDHPEELLQKAEDLATLRDKDFFLSKAQKMLEEMIDPTSMLVWFIENYPTSARILKENPDYQNNFK